MAKRRTNRMEMDIDDFFCSDDLSKSMDERREKTKERFRKISIEHNLKSSGINFDFDNFDTRLDRGRSRYGYFNRFFVFSGFFSMNFDSEE